MVAEFYIIAESFEENTKLSKEEIEERIKSLSRDFIYIRKYKETNKLLIHPDIYNVRFINDVLISDLLFNNEIANRTIDRDVRVSLQKIIIESENTDISSQEVKEILISKHSNDTCHGLIAFHEVKDIKPEYQIIYNINGWLEFRRYFLGIYPGNANFFIDECIKYFPNLFFHSKNKDTVNTILHNCAKKIIYNLTALNDFLREAQKDASNRTEALEKLSIIAELDEVASLEGNASRKRDLTLSFLNKENEMEDVCCEPHLKLCYNDNYPGDSSYATNRRIYFHEGKPNIQEGKILIGHIGEHL